MLLDRDIKVIKAERCLVSGKDLIRVMLSQIVEAGGHGKFNYRVGIKFNSLSGETPESISRICGWLGFSTPYLRKYLRLLLPSRVLLNVDSAWMYVDLYHGTVYIKSFYQDYPKVSGLEDIGDCHIDTVLTFTGSDWRDKPKNRAMGMGVSP